jgi:hypothetical protein
VLSGPAALTDPRLPHHNGTSLHLAVRHPIHSEAFA